MADTDRYEDGTKNSHKINDPKDSRSLKDRAAAEHKLEKEEDEAAKHKPRPTEIAESHGNKPSKGAIMDENIQLEEEAELRKKGKI